MSEGFKLEYPDLDSEEISVKGFLNLKSAKIKMGKITVLIGEQASGKSILAKLQYFFWKYQSDLFDIETVSQKTIARHNKDKVGEFFELFSVTGKNSKPFKIEYKNKDIEICLERTAAGHRPKITVSNFVENLYKKLKKARQDYRKYTRLRQGVHQINEKESEKEREAYEKISRSRWELTMEIDKFSSAVPDVLYVPASRSFFSTIEDNVFAFLSKRRESLDPLIIQFGDFYEYAKKIHQRPAGYRTEKNNRRGTPIIKDVLKGEFIQKNDKDIIRTLPGGSGDVELKHASSGQKESLPLILSLLYFPSFRQNFKRSFGRSFARHSERSKNQLIIIEEPEAHLFPTAQKRILEAIVEVVKDNGCSILLATHSPYIPTCLNNEILIAQNKDKPLTVTAYHVSNGKTQDIYDKEDDLIDTNQLDSASGEIMSEYFKALEEYDARTEGKDKSGE